MKVLHVLYALQPSGMETMLHASADLWRTKRVEVHLLANADEEGPYAAALRARGYTIHHLPWCRSNRHLPAFWRLLRRERYDAVHLHTYRGYPSLAATARLAGIRHIVYTTHGIFGARDGLRWCLHMTRRHCARALGVQFVSVGRSVQENEKKTFGLDTELVWNWADPIRFARISTAERAQARARLNIAPDRFVLMSVGNCSGATSQRTKNHRLILEGMAGLPAAICEKMVFLHVGKEDTARGERRLAGSLGVDRNVHFMGPQTNVRDFLSAADLYVMSSLGEGLGVAAIEAAFCGLPLLLTDVPGLRDFQGILRDEIFVTGLDVSGMTSALERIARMPRDQLAAMGARGRSIAEEVFSMEKGVARYLALYGGHA